MAAPERRSSTGMERRTSTRLSMEPEIDDEDDYEYDLQADGVSDGFRPTQGPPDHHRTNSHASNPDQTATARSPTRPLSTAKPKGIDSFALQHDGTSNSGLARNSMNATHVTSNRSSQASTDIAFIRPESPYQGPSQPSHPYHMYPQESRISRAMSVAPSVAGSVTGPTHPYGMYPQTTAPEVESSAEQHPTAIVPAGFPGLNNNYQRRIGPDGEEMADMIGPDGHTEPLPPYTKYPDHAMARKTQPTVQVPSTPSPVEGAGGMGLATRDPEFSSREDLESPRSRHSTRSVVSEGSAIPVNASVPGTSEKPELKKWQLVARRKVCAIVPIWALVLAAVILLIFVIILVAVLAILKPDEDHHHRPPSASGGYSIITTTFDATPITSIPAGLPALPTGSFALPVNIPSTIQNSCLLNTADSNAWSCSIPGGPLQMTVTSNSGPAVVQNNLSLLRGNYSFNLGFPYGAQAPVISVPQALTLVIDSQDSQKGPAWFVQVPYNKLVVVEENALPPPSQPASKRDLYDRHPITQFMGRGVAQPGDKPWFCYWNNTLLEVYIYVNLTSGAASQTASFTYTPGMAPSTQGLSSTSTSSLGSVTATATTSSGPQQQYSNPVFPPGYPKVVKVEERRIPLQYQSVSPYCVQNIILDNGTAVPWPSSTNPVIIYLNETEPNLLSPISDKRDLLKPDINNTPDIQERDSSASCGCVWLAT